MNHFKAYLLSKRLVPEKKLAYYLSWVSQFHAFCDKKPGDDVSADEIDCFLKHLTKSREELQGKQASEAIRLYVYYGRRKYQSKTAKGMETDSHWKAVAEERWSECSA